MSRLGLDGFEKLVPEEMPKAASVLVLVPPAEEKDQIAAQFLLEGLKNGDAAIVLESEAGVRDLSRRLGNLGFDADKAIGEGRLAPLDWFTAAASRQDVEAGLPAVQAALATAVAAAKVFPGLRIVADLSGSLPEPLDPAALDPAIVKLAEAAKSAGALSLFFGPRAHGLGASVQESFDLILDLRPLKPSGIGLAVITIGGTPLPRSHMTLETKGGRLVLEPPRLSAASSAPVECPVCRSTIPAGAPECPVCRSPRPVRRPGEPDVLDYIEALGQRVGMQEAPIEPGAEAPAPPSEAGRETAPAKAEPSRRGLTNGLAKEGPRAPGRTNGLTNGLARKPGPAPGRVNGLTFTIASARKGLTNGLTNGNGFTNGLGARRFSSEGRRAAWRVYLIPALATVLLLVPVLLAAPQGQNFGIDGDFTDWLPQRVALRADPALPASIDLAYAGIRADDARVYGFLETRGPILEGDGVRDTDSLRMFLDADGDGSTGYRAGGIGAEYLVQISGVGHAVVSSTVSEFPPTADPSNWSAWQGYDSVATAIGGASADANRIEFAFAPPVRRDLTAARALFDSVSAAGEEDVGDVVLAPHRSVLEVRQTSIAPDSLTGAVAPLLELTLRTSGGSAVLTGLRVVATGTYPVVSLNSASLTDPDNPGTPVATASTYANGFTFDLGAGLTASATERTLQVLFNVDAAVPGTLGAIVEKDSDLHVQGAGAYLTTVPAARDRAYVGAVPAGVVVDGAYAEWPNPAMDPAGDTAPGGDPDIDITAYDSIRSAATVGVYAEVAGRALRGSLVPARNPALVPGEPSQSVPLPSLPKRGEDTLRVFIDSDANASTGYAVLVGADFMVEIVGREGEARASDLFQFAGGTATGSWSWQRLRPVPLALGTRHLELLASLLPSTPVAGTQVLLDFRAWRGDSDLSGVATRSGTRSPAGATVDAGAYTADLPADLLAGDAIRVTADGFDVSWRLSGVLAVDEAGGAVSLPLASDPLVATASSASYGLAVGGVPASLRYAFGPESMKEELVLSAVPEGLGAALSLRMRFSLDLSPGASLLALTGLPGTEGFGNVGDVAIVVGGETRALFPRPFALDADSVTIPCTYEAPSALALDVSCPADALHTASYPVRIDPSVTYQLNYSTSYYPQGEQLGWSVAVGDFNGDSYADVLTGAPFNAKNATQAGAAYIYLGPFSSDRTTPSVILKGNETSCCRSYNFRAGYAVAAGDFNNDGYSDAVVAQQNRGPVLVFNGRASWPSWVGTADKWAWGTSLLTASETFGRALVAGNFDGSGGDDLVVGRPFYPQITQADGRAYLYFSPLAANFTTPSLTLAPFNNTRGKFGWSLAAGKIDSDSRDDLIVGETTTTPDAGVHEYGRISLFKGSSLTGSGTKTPDSWIMNLVSKAQYGASLAVGRLNAGDSYADVAVGAPADSTNSGKAYLYLAKSDGTGLDKNQSAAVTISNQAAAEKFGTSVAIGDYFNDGAGDVVVGAEYYNAERGRVYAFNDPLSDQAPDDTITGTLKGSTGEHLGHAVVIGKSSNDPLAFLVVGGNQWGDATRDQVGRVLFALIPEFPDMLFVAGVTAVVVLVVRRRRDRLAG